MHNEGPALRVRGLIPLAALPVGDRHAGPVPPAAAEDGAASWDLYLKPAGQGRIRVMFPAEVAEAFYTRGGREIAVERSRYGNVTLAERAPKPVLDGHSWGPDGSLLVHGAWRGPAGAGLELVLRSPEVGGEYVIGGQRDGDRFSATARPAAMPTFGEPLPLPDGPWDVLARSGDGPVMPAGYDHGRLAEISHKKVAAGPKLYAFTTADYDSPVITAEPRLRLSEQGNFNRRVLRRALYPIQSRRPLRDAVLFVSWNGKQCTDNPRGIAEELRRRAMTGAPVGGDGLRGRGPRGRPGGAVRDRGVLRRARPLPVRDLQRRHAAVLPQAGGPDLPADLARDPAEEDRLRHRPPAVRQRHRLLRPPGADIGKWDLLLSQNPFSTPIFRRAFRYEGEICEYGYPRNDILTRGGPLAGQVRRRLGIPDGKRVVMYVPTWRDNQFYASGRYRFDLRIDLERAWQVLGPDHVLLIRGHHHLANDVTAGTRRDFALNVTGYPSISELFLITDVLITDYSSAMFDFAVTGRPMLFFTYDLEQYRDQLRGFCFDFEAEAPGPLLASPEEVLAAARDTAAATAGYAAAYQAFAAKYCPLDDGKAGARVCDRLFGS
jgi:CDP-glycerol glycerophosphotransferase